MEHIDDADLRWLRGSRPVTPTYTTGDLDDIPPENLLPEVFTLLDTKRILSHTKWASLNGLPDLRPVNEEERAEKELMIQQPKLYIKKYHKMIMDRARNRAPAHLVSPHALTEMPAQMLDSIEGEELSLKPHQLTGVGEMLYLESNEPHGGILADEMGLGKTVQIIALICASLEMQGDKYDPKPTLIVTPKTLLPMWMEQLKIWANRLMILRYHGSNRKNNFNREDFENSHITVTTYGDVRSEYKDYRAVSLAFQAQASHRGGRASMPKLPPPTSRIFPLMTASWHRVILEEAHVPRNTSKQLFKAVYFLQAHKRWAITGTPFMNDYTDLQSLFKFLRVKPWCSDHLFHAHFMLKKKDRVTSSILEPIRNKVLVATFQSLAIRRERGSIFDGQPITDTQQMNEFNIELDLDDGTKFGSPASYAGKSLTEQQCQTRYGPLWNEDGIYDSDVEKEELNTFRLYSFMLMTAIHYASHRGGYSDMTEDEEHQQMGLTHEGEDEVVDTAPTHGTVRTRFKDHIRGLEHKWHSTKIDKCVSIIQETLEDVNSGKILVFCEYMTCLDIVGVALEDEGIHYADLNGQMSLTERTNIVQRFQDEEDPAMPRVLLITSKCGSYGLTLTAASTVIMLNNSWTPLNDKQCIARANRMGQKRVVSVYRLHMKFSMEDRKAIIAREKGNKFNQLMTNARAIDGNTTDEETEELVSTAIPPRTSSANPQAAQLL